MSGKAEEGLGVLYANQKKLLARNEPDSSSCCNYLGNEPVDRRYSVSLGAIDPKSLNLWIQTGSKWANSGRLPGVRLTPSMSVRMESECVDL